MSRVFRFRCGHVGRSSEGTGYRAKVRVFIRVAELRGAKVIDVHKNCPDCGKGH